MEATALVAASFGFGSKSIKRNLAALRKVGRKKEREKHDWLDY